MPENLFIIDLNYQAPLEKLDEAMDAHVAFLNKRYEAGDFITSGRKVPRTGGIIIARAKSKEEVELWMQDDPFYNQKLSDFTITEFIASQAQPLIRELLKKPKN